MVRYDWPAPHASAAAGPLVFAAANPEGSGGFGCNSGVPVPLNTIGYGPDVRTLVVALSEVVTGPADAGLDPAGGLHGHPRHLRQVRRPAAVHRGELARRYGGVDGYPARSSAAPDDQIEAGYVEETERAGMLAGGRAAYSAAA